MTLDEFLTKAVNDCVNATFHPPPDPDIGMCDLCGSEDGDRVAAVWKGCAVWLCAECRVPKRPNWCAECNDYPFFCEHP